MPARSARAHRVGLGRAPPVGTRSFSGREGGVGCEPDPVADVDVVVDLDVDVEVDVDEDEDEDGLVVVVERNADEDGTEVEEPCDVRGGAVGPDEHPVIATDAVTTNGPIKAARLHQLLITTASLLCDTPALLRIRRARLAVPRPGRVERTKLRPPL